MGARKVKVDVVEIGIEVGLRGWWRILGDELGGHG
jgi:hypothetical protein